MFLRAPSHLTTINLSDVRYQEKIDRGIVTKRGHRILSICQDVEVRFSRSKDEAEEGGGQKGKYEAQKSKYFFILCDIKRIITEQDTV